NGKASDRNRRRTVGSGDLKYNHAVVVFDLRYECSRERMRCTVERHRKADIVRADRSSGICVLYKKSEKRFEGISTGPCPCPVTCSLEKISERRRRNEVASRLRDDAAAVERDQIIELTQRRVRRSDRSKP